MSSFRLLDGHFSHCPLEETLPHICLGLVSSGVECKTTIHGLLVTVKVTSGFSFSYQYDHLEKQW